MLPRLDMLPARHNGTRRLARLLIFGLLIALAIVGTKKVFAKSVYQEHARKEVAISLKEYESQQKTSSGEPQPSEDTPKTTNPLTFTPNVPIPGLFEDATGKGIPVDETLFGRYISGFYIFFVGVAGIFAVVMMMWGGFHYIVSAGNPQKMNQGKEIISNALIGLVLVLTSYLLLNLINPRLTKLRVPSLSYINQALQPGIYCESQGPEAATAVEKQKKECGDTVEYEVKGIKHTCLTLFIPHQEGKPWDEQLVCIPYQQVAETTQNGEKVRTTEVKLKRVLAAGPQGVCENSAYTSDGSCDQTQQILSLEKWLQGACKKADIIFTGITGQDVCRYKKFFRCPPSTGQVSCKTGQVDGTGECWEKGRPRTQDTGVDKIRAHCVEPSSSVPPIEDVDAVCCEETGKDYIVCSDQEPLKTEAVVDCEPYNSKPGEFLTQCTSSTIGVGGVIQFRLKNFGHCGVEKCPKGGKFRCFAPLTFSWYQLIKTSYR